MPEEIELDDDEGRQMYQSGELWRRLLQYRKEQYLLGTAFICDGEAEKVRSLEFRTVSVYGALRNYKRQRQQDNGYGLLQNHAYGIMDVRESQGHKLIKCRNPWGQKEWKG